MTTVTYEEYQDFTFGQRLMVQTLEKSDFSVNQARCLAAGKVPDTLSEYQCAAVWDQIGHGKRHEYDCLTDGYQQELEDV